MPELTIGRAALQAGVGVETVRFYERRDLIDRPRRPAGGGFRTYAPETIARIRFIREAQEIGFSLREIADLLSLRADPSADCSDIRLRAIAKRDEVDRKIAQLRQVRGALETLIAACPGGGALRACTILQAIEQRGMRPDARVSRADRQALARAPLPKRRNRKGRTAMKALILTIDGMHCEGCARTIEALVRKETGVRKIEASYKRREARVLFDPEAVSEVKLVAAVEKAGYRVTDRRP